MQLTGAQSIARPGWQRTLAIVFFAQLITAVGFSSIFPFLPLYVASLGSTTSLSNELLAGLVYSAQAFTMMIASPIWGALADRYGRKLMVQRAAFGGSILLLLMAFVQNAEQLVVLRAIQGLVTGTMAASNALVAAAAPRERMGSAMGLMQVATGAGVAVGPLIGGTAADAFGYAAAFYITAALLFLAGLLVLFGVQEAFEPPDAQAIGLRAMASAWQDALAQDGIGLGYALRFMTSLGRMMILPITPLFIQSLLTAEARLNTFTGLVTGSSAATTTLGAIALGRLGDQSGHRRVLVASTVAAAVLYVPQSMVNAGWQLLALQAGMGLALGGVVPTISALLARYSRAGREGAIYGLDNSIEAAARAVAPLAGAGVALWLGLRAVFLATGLLFLLTAFAAAWRLPEPRRPRDAGADQPRPPEPIQG